MSSDDALARATALMGQRRHVAAEAVLDASTPVVRKNPGWALLAGVVQTRLGRTDRACELLHPLLQGGDPWATEACAALADLYHFTQRHDDLRRLLAQDRPWTRTPRGQLFAARLLAASDPTQAVSLLQALADSAPAGGGLRRIAGFDAVKLLDRSGRYREAFDLAARLHAQSPAFDLDGFLASLQLQKRLLSKGRGWCLPRTEAVDGAAFVVGMPRSGTTLVEQMLDCHPEVAGIGEHEGIGDLAGALVSAGVWPYRLNHLPCAAASAMRAEYTRTARRHAASDARWTLDKSLSTWRFLPALAAILPGAVSLRVMRDARDMAISSFLSFFDPLAFGWTASLVAIRRVIEAERALVPMALQTLELPHETIIYEDLVADPRGVMQRCLTRLGLPMDDRVLAPERSVRTAMTLSHEQVRRPVNDASIGRWRHYAFAFDSAWDALTVPQR